MTLDLVLVEVSLAVLRFQSGRGSQEELMADRVVEGYHSLSNHMGIEAGTVLEAQQNFSG